MNRKSIGQKMIQELKGIKWINKEPTEILKTFEHAKFLTRTDTLNIFHLIQDSTTLMDYETLIRNGKESFKFKLTQNPFLQTRSKEMALSQSDVHQLRH